ncbi:MAG: hypothetical protein ACRC6V_19410 [Bacteroidales bacterium]
MKVNSEHRTKRSGLITIIGYTDSKNILVKFKDTGNEKVVQAHHIRSGYVCDSAHMGPASVEPGTIHSTSNHGHVEVVENNGMLDIVVRFATGKTKSVRASALRRGYITPF